MRLTIKRLGNPQHPFRPDQLPFYYGWVILAASILGVLASIPGQTIGVSVFTEPLLVATGLSRIQLSSAYLTGTLISGLLLPYGGRLVDQLGTRVTAMGAALALSLTLFGLSQLDQFLAISFVNDAPSIKFGIITVGFFCLRFSGQGMLTMSSRTMLGRWFNRYRGLAGGISGVFVSLGFSIAPQVFHVWIQQVGWRSAWYEMSLLIGACISLVIYTFYRDNPEQCGLHLDGEHVPLKQTSTTIGEDEEMTRNQALRSRAFWAVTSVLSCQSFISTAITFHILDIGRKSGIEASEAIFIFVPIAILSTAIGFGSGVLADYIKVKYLMMCMMGAQIIGVVSISDLGFAPAYALAICGLGVAGGCFGAISSVALPRYCGRTHLGAISGVEMMCMVMTSALGPLWLAISLYFTGTYTTGLYGFCVLPLLSGLLAWSVKEAVPRGARITSL
ncbi:MAG: MFS transporter [Myxococcales bacterium]|nr:MFS transporter [Myxococcales bacterium]